MAYCRNKNNILSKLCYLLEEQNFVSKLELTMQLNVPYSVHQLQHNRSDKRWLFNTEQ